MTRASGRTSRRRGVSIHPPKRYMKAVGQPPGKRYERSSSGPSREPSGDSSIEPNPLGHLAVNPLTVGDTEGRLCGVFYPCIIVGRRRAPHVEKPDLFDITVTPFDRTSQSHSASMIKQKKKKSSRRGIMRLPRALLSDLCVAYLLTSVVTASAAGFCFCFCLFILLRRTVYPRFPSAVRAVTARCGHPFALRPGLSYEDEMRRRSGERHRAHPWSVRVTDPTGVWLLRRELGPLTRLLVSRDPIESRVPPLPLGCCTRAGSRPSINQKRKE